jgi:hypothetical protein
MEDNMTKKDYIKLVQAIREARLDQDHNQLDLGILLTRLCNILKADNKLFDEDKFYTAVYAKGKD